MQVKDITGIPLEPGHKVTWGVGGRHNYGIVLGEVLKIEEETYEHKDYDYTNRVYLPATQHVRYWVHVKTLDSGRKGGRRLVRDGVADVVCIMDQSWLGVTEPN